MEIFSSLILTGSIRENIYVWNNYLTAAGCTHSQVGEMVIKEYRPPGIYFIKGRQIFSWNSGTQNGRYKIINNSARYLCLAFPIF